MISPELKALFTEPYEKSQEIDVTFDRIRVEQGNEAAISYLKSIGAKYLDFKSYLVTFYLDAFTKNNQPYEERCEGLKSLVDGKEVFNVTIEHNKEKKRDEITLETISGKMHAMRFTEVCPRILEDYPELESDGRNSNCFLYAYEFMKRIGRPCQMVTGYVYGYTDLSKFLHSWLEVKFKGKTYVIDGTRNLMMDKEAYYNIKHAVPITKISQKTFIDDIKNHYNIFDGITLPVYLLYRNELIAGKEMKKEKFDAPNGFTKR